MFVNGALCKLFKLMISVQTGNHEKKKNFQKKVIPKGNSFAFSMCAFLGGAIEAFFSSCLPNKCEF